ncbi:type IV conjugative transfer system protein TraE [Vibrio alginolyticus]|uniref:type IV conjugative transfer system protein TraE n=1 Tax=Vibrio alginolyticus TaxID=663 RepID=UPI00211A720E|nr:type IV conjugative transfer system protein TraE [Vibrio alginolyticus]MCQ9090582.1 pilus assembly protein [Vibrio alginolyticus]
MNLKAYLKTWEGTQAENKWGRIFVLGLIFTVLLLAVKLFSKETIVTVQPWTLNEEAWVSQENASQSYKEAWGWALGTLMGNVTPGNVNFIKERMEPILAPTIYQEFIDALEIQAQEIQADRITMRFEPRFVEYEETTDKVFVYGHSFVKGAAFDAKEQRTDRTYEFELRVSNYMPVLDYMTTYEGRPRTKSVLDKLERKEESRRKRNEG